MAVFCDHEVRPILEAVQQWRKQCLLSDGSILSSDSVWNLAGFKELYENFSLKPNDGEGKFLEKLKGQLEEAKPETKQLASEILWLMYLFIYKGSMLASTKRSQISQVWAWSGNDLNLEHPMLKEPLEEGVGNPGTAYGTLRWAEVKSRRSS